MSVTMIPGTYKLDIDLASDWSVEMRFIKPVGTRAPSAWQVETTLPFDIEYVVVNGGEYYFYDKRKKEMLERFEEDEVKEFFNEKKYLIEYLKTISPVDNWELIG
jgi:coenzyme F420-reducing hydrogenase alpha subunit